MSLPKSILYPVDFSPRSSSAWPAVAFMARRLEVPVTLLHAFDTGYTSLLQSVEGCLPPLDERAVNMLASFETAGLEVPSSSRKVIAGSAAKCIVEQAERMDAPWVMMPTRGHTRFRQLLLGSVTTSVLHDALCPVWTEAHTETGPAHREIQRAIVCAADIGVRAPALLAAAHEVSSKFAVPLQIIHSVPNIDPHFSSAVSDRAHALLIANARDAFSSYRREAGFAFDVEIVEDSGLAAGIVNFTRALNADLLIIGRGVIRGPLGRLRTNAHDLIRQSPCAVLSV